MKKLTRAQQEVVNYLKFEPDWDDKIIRIWPNDYWIQGKGVTFKPHPLTINALLRLNIIKPTDQKDIYVLSEKE